MSIQCMLNLARRRRTRWRWRTRWGRPPPPSSGTSWRSKYRARLLTGDHDGDWWCAKIIILLILKLCHLLHQNTHSSRTAFAIAVLFKWLDLAFSCFLYRLSKKVSFTELNICRLDFLLLWVASLLKLFFWSFLTKTKQDQVFSSHVDWKILPHSIQLTFWFWNWYPEKPRAGPKIERSGALFPHWHASGALDPA